MLMRFDGVIQSWNADRGFGLIAPDQGGQEVFVHITALPARSQPPALNQRVTFEVELNREGKKRAKNVALVRPAQAHRQRTRSRATDWGGASLFAVPAFVLLYVVVALVWRVPKVVAVVYLVMSVTCFVTYAIDKFAAKSGGWRTKETTLLMLGLVGGWPGAMLAQQFLRHKSIKASFRVAFWITVVINVAGFIALSSPKVGAWNALR